MAARGSRFPFHRYRAVRNLNATGSASIWDAMLWNVSSGPAWLAAACLAEPPKSLDRTRAEQDGVLRARTRYQAHEDAL